MTPDNLIADLYPVVRGVVNSWAASADERDDWTQEAFVEILRSLPGLREPAAIRAWAAVIARRLCLRMLSERAKSPDAPALHGGNRPPDGETWLTSAPAPADRRDDELQIAVRRALERLAPKHRRVMELFYLRERSISDVARTINAPAGTVKRWLKEGRGFLGKELETMPAVQEIRKAATRRSPAHFMWWGEGCRPGTTSDVWPWTLLDGLLAQQVLFSVRQEAKSPEAIARSVGAEVAYVEDIVDRFVRNELMVRERSSVRADFFFISRAEEKRLHELLSECGAKSAAVVEAKLAEIQHLAQPELRWGQRATWNDLQWVMICLFTCNLAVRSALEDLQSSERFEPPLRPDGHRFCLFAWEGARSMGAGGWKRDFGNAWATGCNSFDPRLGFFWTPQVNRREWPGHFNWRMLAATFAPEPVALPQVRETTQREMGRQPLDFEADLARLLELRLVRRSKGRLSPAFPVFTAEFWREAEPLFRGVGAQVAEAGLRPLAERLDGLFDEMGFKRLHAQYPAARACVLSDALSYLPAELRRRGKLPDPPANVEPNWGFWGSEVPCPML